MFWRVTGLAQVSPVELILNKSDFTLEELLEEEELIQECKSLNGKLISFLKQKEVVERLIGYIVDEGGPAAPEPAAPSAEQSPEGPPAAAAEADADADAEGAGSTGADGAASPSSSAGESGGGGEEDDSASSPPPSGAGDGDDGSSRQFKYPFLACEIFCCEVESIFSTIIENEHLLKKLFGFLERPDGDAADGGAGPRRLNTLLAGYFSRVASAFIVRYMPEFMQFLRANLEIIDNLIDNLENTSIAEVLMRLVGADEQTITYHGECVQWLDETDLLRQLLGRVRGGAGSRSDREAINASEVLVAISRTAPSSLASSLASPASIGELLAAVDSPSAVCLTSALTVVLSVLDPRRSCMGAMQGTPGGMAPGMLTSSPPGLAAAQQAQRQMQAGLTMAAAIEDLFVGRLPALVSLLGVEGAPGEMEMSYGVLRPPLGQMRLRTVEVLSMLFRTGGAKASAALIEAGALGVLLGLMRRYPFNNFLHSEIEYVVCSIFDGNSPAMVSHAMDGAKILSVLAGLPATVDSVKPNTDKVVTWAAGYNGHVTRICNEISSVAAENATVAAAAEGDPEWLAFVEGVLKPRNAKEDVQKWSCGRPARLEDNYIESDDELTFDSIGGGGRGGDDDGGVTGLPSLLQGGRYGGLDDGNDGDLSQMLDGIDDNDEDDVYFADNGGGGAGGGGADAGAAAGGAPFEAQGFGANFAQFAFRDDDGAADDDVVVVEGDDVTEVQLNVEAVMGPSVMRASTPVPTAMVTNADGTAVSSSSAPSTSYMEKLVQGMQRASIGTEKEEDKEEEEAVADFNTFNYWKPTYEVEVPDDA